MIYYMATCIFCKKEFRIIEGTNKYRVFKQNMQGKYPCDDCDRQNEDEAKRNLMGS
jgi:DNA-directed RNA polymerase subunit RPC12/RpoP